MEYEGGNDADISVGKVIQLQQNGDFRSPECIELLEQSDIVVTNPPFSIAREHFIPLLIEHNKKFVIIGDLNWITYKNIFPLLKDDVMWLGYNTIKEFRAPDGSIKKFGNKLWYTNVDIEKRHELIDLVEKYSPEVYPKYDNYNIINVDKTLNIPADYVGVMGVPISFLEKFCPGQFEILGLANSARYLGNLPCLTFINGKKIYNRILIKRKG